jgi:hypothetical protein
MKDLRLARARLKRTGVARWLFNFAYADLESLSEGQLTDYGFDILALFIPGDPKSMNAGELLGAAVDLSRFTLPDEPLALYFEKLKPVLDQYPPNTWNEETIKATEAHLEEKNKIMAEAQAMPRVPLSVVVGFHDELKQKFEGFFHGHYWNHIEPASVKWLLARGVRPHDGAWKADSFENPEMQLQPIERLMLIAGRAVLAEREKFSVCESCKNPFMAIKNPRRKHCSEACSQRLRTQRFIKNRAQGISPRANKKRPKSKAKAN